MAEVQNAKKDFILSLKQLQHFFNNLKSVHGQHDTTLSRINDAKVLKQAQQAKVHNQEQLLSSPRALRNKDQELDEAFQFQEQQKYKLASLLQELENLQVSPEEMNPKINPDARYFEMAVEAINQASKFSHLIDTQENEVLKRQIQNKQQVVEACNNENQDLQEQLDQLLAQIEDKKILEKKIRDDIKKEEERTSEVIKQKEISIQQSQDQLAETHAEFNSRIEQTYQVQNEICHQKHQLAAQLKFLKQRNALLCFYPGKVNEQKEILLRKQEELELYQDIINRTFEFITERIDENEKKHLLVEELNQYVGNSVQRILDDEKIFYDQEQKDRLKVPPYNLIKRIPRDYSNEIMAETTWQKQKEEELLEQDDNE